MPEVAIFEAFTELSARRCSSSQHHTQALCLALFTLAFAAGKKKFLTIGDWSKAYKDEIVVLFQPPKSRLPSYSTIRCVVRHVRYVSSLNATAKEFNERIRGSGLLPVSKQTEVGGSTVQYS